MALKRRGLGWLATGAAGNALAGAIAARAACAPDGGLPAAVRGTGNGTFVAFAAPFVLRAGRADRRHWWAYVGAHATHVTFLVDAARRHRTTGGSFSATSRYGGALGYTTIAMFAATSYAPGGTPCADPSLRLLHRVGEQFLFGLYAVTIVHGYAVKGRDRKLYGPLAALWLIAAIRGRARWQG
ncbi:MAG: hypothetical protein QOH76_2764 [Thermoleophilaceae bacterium]|nr:hypothetical protein [Thermoleophilaceae bacterium]